MKKIRAIVLVHSDPPEAGECFIEGTGDGEFECRVNRVELSGGTQDLGGDRNVKRVLVEVEYEE